jgi:hypothetical protein
VVPSIRYYKILDDNSSFYDLWKWYQKINTYEKECRKKSLNFNKIVSMNLSKLSINICDLNKDSKALKIRNHIKSIWPTNLILI